MSLAPSLPPASHFKNTNHFRERADNLFICQPRSVSNFLALAGAKKKRGLEFVCLIEIEQQKKAIESERFFFF